MMSFSPVFAQETPVLFVKHLHTKTGKFYQFQLIKDQCHGNGPTDVVLFRL